MNSADSSKWLDLLPKVDRLLALLALTALVVMKTLFASHYRFNTDETQHLHVIWGWTRGYIQYRDIFDNHPPLFHMLMAPIFRLFPERADIVIPMRKLMIPFFIAILTAVFCLARSLYSPRPARWLALAGCALPAFFFPVTEFRPDDLYGALWFCALAIILARPFTLRRMACFGLLMGACIGITMKTSLLAASLGLSFGIAMVIRTCRSCHRPSPRAVLLSLLVLGGATLVIPALLCLYFAMHGALADLAYYTLKHNIVPHAERWGGSPLHFFYLPLALPFFASLAWWHYRQTPDPETATRRVIVLLLPLIYLVLLFGYWPDVTAQDYIPCVPLLPFLVMPLVIALGGVKISKLRPAITLGGFIIPPAAVTTCLLMLWNTKIIQKGDLNKYIMPIATILRLTSPDDYVMDLKGDAIYRKRPFYTGIETFAIVRMKLGWIKNTIVPDLIATRTQVCFHFPYPSRPVNDFFHANYLPLLSPRNVAVLGQKLAPDPAGLYRFTITIPSRYLIIQGDAAAAGLLDGTPLTDARLLTAGAHTFQPATPSSAPLVLFWSRAWREGYRPDLLREMNPSPKTSPL